MFPRGLGYGGAVGEGAGVVFVVAEYQGREYARVCKVAGVSDE